MSSNEEDQQFKIQPHPQDSHSNEPTGSEPSSLKQGAATSNPGPRILDNDTASKLETPKSKEELANISSSLNQDDDGTTSAPAITGQEETAPAPTPSGARSCCTCM